MHTYREVSLLPEELGFSKAWSALNVLDTCLEASIVSLKFRKKKRNWSNLYHVNLNYERGYFSLKHTSTRESDNCVCHVKVLLSTSMTKSWLLLCLSFEGLILFGRSFVLTCYSSRYSITQETNLPFLLELESPFSWSSFISQHIF